MGKPCWNWSSPAFIKKAGASTAALPKWLRCHGDRPLGWREIAPGGPFMTHSPLGTPENQPPAGRAEDDVVLAKGETRIGGNGAPPGGDVPSGSGVPCASYVRYSSDMQEVSSNIDQQRKCR